VREIAQARGVKNAQIALAWMLSKPLVSAPIIGESKPYQLEDAPFAMEFKLSDEEIKRLEEPYGPHPVLGIEV
jgi:aryl-alcohol dehydrogenase-like predicted oxidoreductase